MTIAVTPADLARSLHQQPSAHRLRDVVPLEELACQVARMIWFRDFAPRAALLARLNLGSPDAERQAGLAGLAGVLDKTVQTPPDLSTYEDWLEQVRLKLRKVDLGKDWSTERNLVTQVIAGALRYDNAGDVIDVLLDEARQGQEATGLKPDERGFLSAIQCLLELWREPLAYYDKVLASEVDAHLRSESWGPERKIIVQLSSHVSPDRIPMPYQRVVQAMKASSFSQQFIVECIDRLAQHWLIEIIDDPNLSGYGSRKIRLAPFCITREGR